MSTLAEKIAVMQAAERGEAIEYAYAGSVGKAPWHRSEDPVWDWATFDYRVKSKPREWWICGDVLYDRMPLASTMRPIHVREVIE